MWYNFINMADGPTIPEKANASNIEPTVRVNQGENKTAEVNITSVNGLFLDIKKYNDQFSLGAMMSRMLLNNLEFEHDQKRENPQAQQPSLAKEEDYQQMSASALSVIHGSVLDQIGLSLEPVSGKNIKIFGQGEQAGVGEMRLNISNEKRFLSLLSSLKPEQVENRALKPNLESLSDVFSRQIFDQYNLTEPSDEALQLFGGLEKIVAQYKRLGMEQAITRLEIYLTHAKQGDLKEYIAIEQRGLLSEPGKSFGPADWQKDTSPESLEGKWEEALRILDVVKKNPKANALYERLETHLKKCVGIAKENIPSLKYYNVEKKTEFIRILEQAKTQLEDQNPSSAPTPTDPDHSL